MESPSPELGWLVCSAVTGSSRFTDGVVEDRSAVVAAAAAAAAAGGLLDDAAFFDHFFGRLTRSNREKESSDDDGDGSDARILEEVNRNVTVDETRLRGVCLWRESSQDFILFILCFLFICLDELRTIGYILSALYSVHLVCVCVCVFFCVFRFCVAIRRP